MNTHEPDRLEAILTDARAETLAQMAGATLGLPASYVALSALYEPLTVQGLRLAPDLSAGLAGLGDWVIHMHSVTGLTGFAASWFTFGVLLILPLYVAAMPPLLGEELAGRLWQRLRGRYTTEDSV